MKKICLLLPIILMLSSCGAVLGNKSISVYYSCSSHAMFEAAQEDIDRILDQYESLQLEETNEELDFFTAFFVVIYEGEEQLARFWVDENLTICADDICYKIESGNFDYNYLMDLYEGSKEA